MDYIQINKDNWNKRLDLHLESSFYAMDDFLNGKSSLKDIERKLLGDLKNKKVLHLQCHFGQDTLSMAREGAVVTGVDLSDKSIAKAKDLSKRLNLAAEFVCCNVLELDNYLNDQFDIVFTSYGTITWLKDLDKWAYLIEKFLKPGGQFIIVDFHPFIWMYDDDLNHVTYSYFLDEAIDGVETGTYANKESNAEVRYVCWNHSLSETMSVLLDKGLKIESFDEYNYSPYNCMPGMFRKSEDVYVIEKFGDKIPIVFSIVASKEL